MRLGGVITVGCFPAPHPVGACLLLVSDTLARTLVVPAEMPLGLEDQPDQRALLLMVGNAPAGTNKWIEPQA